MINRYLYKNKITLKDFFFRKIKNLYECLTPLSTICHLYRCVDGVTKIFPKQSIDSI